MQKNKCFKENKTTPEYKILNWDSEVFGFGVARILTDKLDPVDLEKILKGLKKKTISLVYWASDAKNMCSKKVVECMGGFLTGQKITYVAELKTISTKFLSRSVKLKEYNKDESANDLINLILKRSIYSRFYIDPKITKKQYEAIHRLWIINSIKNNAIFVIKENDKIIGFVSLNEMDNRGNIDFIVVDQSFSRKGLGSTLMCAAHNWFISNGYKVVQAITQKENIIASNMYEKFGYHIEKTENFYHFWL